MKVTPNYGLKKPDGSDIINVDDFNKNTDIIDTKLKELETNETFYAVATGSANNYILSISALSPLNNYYDGLSVCAKINIESTGSSTININGWGAKPIYDTLGNQITAGGLKANTPYPFRYESTRQAFILVAKGGGGTVTADKLLIGYTATGDTGLVNGSMPDNGAINITPSTTAKTIPKGYTSGGTVAGDSNLISDYILGSKSIFGVQGKASNVDTSDALATASQILAGASAYVNGLKVLGNIQSRSATTYNPSTTAQTIPQGLYLSGVQTIAPVTGTANVGQVLAGYGFSSANGINLTGTIPSKGATTYTPSTANQTIASGQYISGTQTILGDPELTPNNIVSNANIFGVQGTATVESMGGTYFQVYASPTTYAGVTNGGVVSDNNGYVYVLCGSSSTYNTIYKLDPKLNLVASKQITRDTVATTYELRYDRFTNLLFYNCYGNTAVGLNAGWYDTNLNFVGLYYRTNRTLLRYDMYVYTLDEVTGDIYKLQKSTTSVITRIDINGNVIYSAQQANTFPNNTTYVNSVGLSQNWIWVMNGTTSNYSTFRKSDGTLIAKTSMGSNYYSSFAGGGATNFVLLMRRYTSSYSDGGSLYSETGTTVNQNYTGNAFTGCFNGNGRVVLLYQNADNTASLGMGIADGNVTNIANWYPFAAKCVEGNAYQGANINMNNEIVFYNAINTIYKVKV